MNIYDLRSDTFTQPSAQMRQVMAEAVVGDDAYHEDPTINHLEEKGAHMLGKEAGIFVSSGTMGNLIPLFINGGRGTEVITHAQSHIIQHEIGALSAIAGVMPITLCSAQGLLRATEIEPLIKPKAYDLAKTAMIEVENTIGGICYPLHQLQEIGKLARKYALSLHMDGARLWNASVATGIPVDQLAQDADTVTVCFSKGLGAPVGSLLCGTKEFIDQARTVRKLLGGGMRQIGILGAAALWALEHNIERLAIDHQGAKLLAQALDQSSWAKVNLEDVQTNMVVFSVAGISSETVVHTLAQKGILCCSYDNTSVRLVTHLNLSLERVKEAADILFSLTKEAFLA